VEEDIKLIKQGKMITKQDEARLIAEYETAVKAKLLRGVSYFEVAPLEG
jgi:hypothetical protein